MQPDYLIIGSGLSALTFGALMANAGKTVQILEAHEHPGGFGHTFIWRRSIRLMLNFTMFGTAVKGKQLIKYSKNSDWIRK